MNINNEDIEYIKSLRNLDRYIELSKIVILINLKNRFCKILSKNSKDYKINYSTEFLIDITNLSNNWYINDLEFNLNIMKDIFKNHFVKNKE